MKKIFGMMLLTAISVGFTNDVSAFENNDVEMTLECSNMEMSTDVLMVVNYELPKSYELSTMILSERKVDVSYELKERSIEEGYNVPIDNKVANKLGNVENSSYVCKVKLKHYKMKTLLDNNESTSLVFKNGTTNKAIAKWVNDNLESHKLNNITHDFNELHSCTAELSNDGSMVVISGDEDLLELPIVPLRFVN